jgi:hypothetical protein
MTETIRGFIYVVGIAFILFVIAIIIVSIISTKSQNCEIDRPNPDSSNLYGCPGCSNSFMDFAQDMCYRLDYKGMVSDKTNTLSCSEIKNLTIRTDIPYKKSIGE